MPSVGTLPAAAAHLQPGGRGQAPPTRVAWRSRHPWAPEQAQKYRTNLTETPRAPEPPSSSSFPSPKSSPSPSPRLPLYPRWADRFLPAAAAIAETKKWGTIPENGRKESSPPHLQNHRRQTKRPTPQESAGLLPWLWLSLRHPHLQSLVCFGIVSDPSAPCLRLQPHCLPAPSPCLPLFLQPPSFQPQRRRKKGRRNHRLPRTIGEAWGVFRFPFLSASSPS
mmetsp:Transcript_6255/g.12360  ORF Transcript_6255/g.12360 Transcript_6255/m.12360 type:complete len:223 (+) Transcript_6255:223-891(+)